jgi:hypothetical protein
MKTQSATMPSRTEADRRRKAERYRERYHGEPGFAEAEAARKIERAAERYHEDPEFRKAEADRKKNYYADPDIKAKRAAYLREWRRKKKTLGNQ